MKKSDLFVGVLISVVTCVVGSFLFIELVAGLNYLEGLQFYRSQGLLGKIIALGAILNLILFFVLLKKNMELMARGIVLGLILLTIITLIV